MISRRIVFVLFEKTHLLDFAGPAQVFYEANQLGKLGLDIIYASTQGRCKTVQGVSLTGLTQLSNTYLTSKDIIVVPGIDFESFKRGDLNTEIQEVAPWLKQMRDKGVMIASICSGSLLLAEAELLNGYACTSHWKCIDFLKKSYLSVRVSSDKLFVKDRRIYTSAGMTSGMDMCLAIIEELYGPVITAETARELVVFLRRDKDHSQESVYLDFQTHYNSGIHRVQQYIITHSDRKIKLSELADIGNTSARNLTRTFRKVTGHTINQFKNRIRIERARAALRNPDLSLEAVARYCGFEDVRQLRRVWNAETGTSLTAYRKEVLIADHSMQ